MRRISTEQMNVSYKKNHFEKINEEEIETVNLSD